MNNFFAAKRLSWERSFLSRVVDAYDIIALRKWHVIGIGIGGAAGVHEDLVRAGVTKITLIDPGSVETCNLATQAYYRSDIGRLKVECLAKRLRRINPYVEVAECSVRLDEIDDARFEQFAFRPFVLSTKPENVLIIGATDDFFAQSRVNRLGLHFGFPTVACQMYDQALAGEVMFFHQQTTPACLRCISSSRHRAYLNGYRNSVGSNGSPITSTTRLNALTATIGLAIMHHGTGHPRWGSLLDQLGDRNLVQVRCHPATAQRLGLPNFDQAFHGASNAQLFCDETIWRPQKPEHPASGYDVPCPECGGTGDLIKAKGTFPDTRLIPI